MSDVALPGRMNRAEALYQAWVLRHASKANDIGLLPDDAPPSLQDIIVPLRLSKESLSDDAPEETIAEQGTGVEQVFEAARARRHPVPIFIQGAPGSGKTTLGQIIRLDRLGTRATPISNALKGHVPFLVRLRFVPTRELTTLEAVVERALRDEVREPNLVLTDLMEFFERGRAVLVLDGLDEIDDPRERERILGWVMEHRWFHRRDGQAALVVVTARPSGFTEARGFLSASQYELWHVAPFIQEQVKLFLTKWFAIRPLPEVQRQAGITRFLDSLDHSPAMATIRTLCRRPAYLAALAFIHGTRGAMPDSRAQLYDLLIDAYLHVLEQVRVAASPTASPPPSWTLVEKRMVLGALAWKAHTADEGPGRDRRTRFTREELVTSLREIIEKLRLRSYRPEDAETFARFLVARTGLIAEPIEGQFQFGHLSFQEFLAAVHALDQASRSRNRVAAFAREVFSRLGAEGWSEVAILALAREAENSGYNGHLTLLEGLDPNNSKHHDFLGDLLSDGAIQLPNDARRLWLIAWILGNPSSASLPGLEKVVARGENHGFLRDAVRAAAERLVGALDAGPLVSWLMAQGAEADCGKADPDDLRYAELWRKEPPPPDRDLTARAVRFALAQSSLLIPTRMLLPWLSSIHGFSEESAAPALSMRTWREWLRGAEDPEIRRRLALRTPVLWSAAAAYDVPCVTTWRGQHRIASGMAIAYGAFASLGHAQSTRQVVSDNQRTSSESQDSFILFVETNRALTRHLARDRAMALALDRVLGLALDRALALARIRAPARDLDWALALARDLARDLAWDAALAPNLDLALERARDLALERARDLALVRDLSLVILPYCRKTLLAIALLRRLPSDQRVIHRIDLARMTRDACRDIGLPCDEDDKASLDNIWTEWESSPLFPPKVYESLLADSSWSNLDFRTETILASLCERLWRDVPDLCRELDWPTAAHFGGGRVVS